VVPEFVVVEGGFEGREYMQCLVFWWWHIAVCRSLIVVENTIILITK